MECKLQVYRALVQPILEYACQVWNPHTQQSIKQIESVQLYGARWICGARFKNSTFHWSPSSNQCCSDLHWPSLLPRRKFFIVLS